MHIPHYNLNGSEVLTKFVDFISIWNEFPTYVKMRQPNKVFSTNTDGYNLRTMYNKCFAFAESQDFDTTRNVQGLSSYFNSLILI